MGRVPQTVREFYIVWTVVTLIITINYFSVFVSLLMIKNGPTNRQRIRILLIHAGC